MYGYLLYSWDGLCKWAYMEEWNIYLVDPQYLDEFLKSQKECDKIKNNN